MTVYQQIITGHHVERAVRDTVRLWTPDYLAEVAEQNGRARGDLPTFRSFLPALDLDRFSEDQIPSCVIVSPGTFEKPRRRATAWDVRWAVNVGCVVSGQDRDNTFELTQLYAAAVRAALVQHPSLGVDWTDGIEWLGERYDELDSDDVRTLMAGSVSFSVGAASAVDSRGGTTVPSIDPAEPADEWSTVEHVSVTTRYGSE